MKQPHIHIIAPRPREWRFDLLRCIAMIGIIFAHIDPPKWMLQIRNFDVPLIVLVSGAVFSFSSGARLPYWDYLQKRVLRIVLPVWIFFTFYFVFSAFFAFLLKAPTPFSLQTIVMTYLFQVSFGGIVYVWLLSVFISMALLMPFLYRIHCTVKKDSSYLLGLLGCFLFYLLILSLWQFFSPTLSPLVRSTVEFDVFLILPYACLSTLGLRLPSLSKSTLQNMIIGSLLLFVILAAYYHHFSLPEHVSNVVWTQKFKYPPQLYYLSYALTVSLALFLLLSRLKNIPSWIVSVVEICSRSTLWIYLWHVFYLSVSKHLPWDDHPFQRFPFVLLFSFGTAILQYYLAKKLLERLPEKKGFFSVVIQHLM